MSILRKQFLAHVGQTSPAPFLVEVERAEGVFLYTPDGGRFFDLISGVSVSNVGHGNPVVRGAIKAQVDSYMHTMVYGETVQRVQVDYAVALCEALASAGVVSGAESRPLDSVYFLNSGAESVEAALKLAKRATGRTGILSMRGAYHGSTHGVLSIQGGEDYKTAFRPLLPDTGLLRFNCFEDLALITSHTACVVVEVVQGESGVCLPVEGYHKALRERCDAVGALLIVDEIQTGLGRCGSLFASSLYGVRPDILCLAKALGGGLPLSALVANKSLMDCFSSAPVLGHISTFGGNPVCCAAGLSAFNFIRENELHRRAEQMGQLFEQLLGEHPKVLEIRRCGLLMAVELGCAEYLYELMDHFKELGIMSDWFLFCDTAFRISPPLTITESEVREVCTLIIESISRLKG